MVLEKNPKTRPMARRILSLQDRISGMPFPGMKRVKQANVYNCGPAVVESLFSFLGVRVAQAAVVRSLKAKKKIKTYGLSIKELSKAVDTLGKKKYVLWKKAGATINDLFLTISKYGYPVAVEWQGVFYEDEDEDNGHYGIVTRINKKAGFLRIADPYTKFAGVDRKFDIKFFKKRWWDSNEIKVAGSSKPRTVVDKKMMFVVTPKGDLWPKKLGMKKQLL